MAVDILSPLAFSTVLRNFTATGTYTPNAVGDPLPAVRLDDADGTLVANSGVVTRAIEEDTIVWSAPFALNANYTKLTLVASLGGQSPAEPNIDVNNGLAPVGPPQGNDMP